MEKRTETIAGIRARLLEAGSAQRQEMEDRYGKDERAGVQKLLEAYRRRMDKLAAEERRIWEMKAYEREYQARGYRCICGIDEAGRGPLAGPERIDEINILQATYEAMRMAVGKLPVKPDLLLNDAVRIPGLDIPQVPVIKGDAKSLSIAAASIVAKVTRDRLMEEYDRLMPQYGFASHKGYGSEAHIRAIRIYGPSPIHRRTFISHFEGGREDGQPE